MAYKLLTCPVLATMCLTLVNSQDDGAGFIFKCDRAGDFALTFDDGPGESTEDLLRILKEKRVKATLFVLGSQVADDNIAPFLKQAYDDGHQIASHTYDHTDLNKLSTDKVRQQMLNTEAEIKKVIGVVPAMMRPPYGNCSDSCNKVMRELGYAQDELIDNILSKIYRSNPSKDSWISLQHDIHQFSVSRTPKIIDRIKAKGYNFVTVTECLSNRLPAYRNRLNLPAPPSSLGTSRLSNSKPIAGVTPPSLPPYNVDRPSDSSQVNPFDTPPAESFGSSLNPPSNPKPLNSSPVNRPGSGSGSGSTLTKPSSSIAYSTGSATASNTIATSSLTSVSVPNNHISSGTLPHISRTSITTPSSQFNASKSSTASSPLYPLPTAQIESNTITTTPVILVTSLIAFLGLCVRI
ncbi:hypothetical protein K7432_009062 [Basidiobolus ranarum]|uniref:NodB homology domain-containing protein n=1 Tax=Basidiobolus ranarum TaxID=34480 RepID=A0ABR2WQX2_9FUNG